MLENRDVTNRGHAYDRQICNDSFVFVLLLILILPLLCSYVLVYRLGGTSSEVTVLRVENGMYRVCSATSDSQFGGDKFTKVLLNYLATEFKR